MRCARCALVVVLVLASLEKHYTTLLMNLLCTSWQHFSENFALRGNSNSNNYGGGYGNGDTVGERGEGSNPPQEITSKHQGHLVQRHISVKAGVGPRLATLQRSFGSKVVVWVTQSQSCRLNMTSPSSQRGKIAP